MIDKEILDAVIPVPTLEEAKDEKVAELKEEGFVVTNFHSGGVFYTLLMVELRIKIELLQLARRILNNKVACTRKEASCIIGSLFGELVPICKKCRQLKEDDIVLETESGLALEIGENLTLEGKSSLSGKPIKIRLTDYGLEFYGDITEITRVKEARCVYIG